MGEFISQLVSNNLTTLVVSSLIGAISWFGSKRYFQQVELKQAETNVEGSITDNVVKNLDVYQRMFKDLDEVILKANKKIDELEAELEEITKLYKELKDRCNEDGLN